MRGRWRWLPLGVLVALVVAALVIGSHHAGASSPSARATRIESEVRCPQCEGQSALESDAPAARAVRTFVSQQIQAGQSDGQIEQALVDRYGSDITLRPSATGITGLVWILPIAAFGIAAGGLTLAFRRWRSATELRPSDADRALVADALHDRDADADARVTTAMADLADERDFLLRSLRDLDAEKEAGDIDPEDYDALRDGYTARAAAVIRELAESTAPETPPEAAPAPKKGRARLVVAGALAGAGILAGVVLARNAGTRLPGDTVSGETPTISPAAGLDAQAQQQISKGDLLGAIKTFDSVLKTTPNDAEALAYKGWLLRLAGSQGKDPQLIDAGLASIRQAEAADPSYPDAHFFAGETLLRDKQDPKGAIVEFQQFLADNPPQSMVAEVQLELQSAQAMAKG